MFKIFRLMKSWLVYVRMFLPKDLAWGSEGRTGVGVLGADYITERDRVLNVWAFELKDRNLFIILGLVAINN